MTTRNRIALALLLVASVLPLAGVAHAQSPSYNLDSGTVRQTWGVGGSTGPTLVNNSGVIEVHAPGGALGIARVTTPVGSTDIANKNYVDTHVSGGSPAGTGIAYVSSGGFASGAVSTTLDVSLGTLSGTSLPATVVGWQGRSVSSMSPSTGQVYSWTGSTWSPGLLTLAGLTPGTVNQILMTVGGVPTWETLSGSCTNVAGVITCSGGGGGGTQTGVGIWYNSTSGTLNGSAIALGGDLTPGSFSAGTLPLTVTQVQGHAWSSSAPSSAQLPVYNSGTWTPTTVSGNGTLSSSGALAVSGFSLSGQTAGSVPWYTGSAWAAVGAGTSGQCLQSSGTSIPTWGSCGGGGGGYTSTTGDVVSSGSGAVATLVEAISGTGSTASVPFNAATLAWSTGNTALSETSGVSSLKMGAYTVFSADSSLLIFGNGVTTQPVSFRANSAEWGQYLGSGSNRGWQLGYNGAGPDFGGGDEVLGISRAVTEPTSLPSTAGDVAIYGWNSSGSWLGLAASGIRPDGPAIGAGNTFTIQPSAITTSSAAGVNLALFGSAPGSGGTPGGVTIQSSDHTGIVAVGTGAAAIAAATSINIDSSTSGSTAINVGATTTGAIAIGNTGSAGIGIVSGGTGVSINTSGSGATTAIGSTSAGSTTIESTNSSFSVSAGSITGEATGGFTLDSPGSANSPFCFGCLFSTGSIALGNANSAAGTWTSGSTITLNGASGLEGYAGSTPLFAFAPGVGEIATPLESNPSSTSTVEHSAAPQGTVNSQAQLVNSLLWGFGETVSSATPKTLYTYTIPTGKGAYGIASVSCRATTAAGSVSVGDSWGASYNFQCQNPSGSANCNSTIIGSAQFASSMSGTMASVAASGASYVVSVTNLATVTVDCTAAITNGIVN